MHNVDILDDALYPAYWLDIGISEQMPESDVAYIQYGCYYIPWELKPAQ